MNVLRRIGPTAVAAIALLAAPSGTAQASDGELASCFLNFDSKSWSAFYKSVKGEGEIVCDNGQRARVSLRGRGGGLTFGKSKIVNGQGTFTDVEDITELFGAYAQASAHGGAGKSGQATVVTKGEVSLAITGTGTGVDAGIWFGKLSIRPIDAQAATRRPERERAVPVGAGATGR